MFDFWAKGSVAIKAPAQSMGSNMYAALENIDSEKRNLGKLILRHKKGNLFDFNSFLGNRPKDTYSSKGHSMERNYPKYEGRGSRSGSQHRSNNSSASSSQRSTPAPMIPPPAVKPVQVIQAVHQIQMTEEQMDRRIDNSLDEFISGNCTVDEYYQEISSIPIKYHPKMIANR